MSKHTPGPWHLDGHEVHAGDGCEFITTFDPRTEVGTANARLIASAPDLLMIAKHAYALLSNLDMLPSLKEPALEMYRAAIAKAEG